MEVQLKELEKKHNIDWRDFKIKDLFDSSNGDVDIKSEQLNGKGYDVVSSGNTNLGIIGKTDINSKIFEKNTITIDMFGSAFYRKFTYKMVTHARVFSLKPKLFNLNDKTGIYFQSCMQYFKKIYSYSDMASFDKIKNRKIKLPISVTGEIAFDYIEEFVSTLEVERLATLEAYLEVTGLRDVKLSEVEQESLRSLSTIGASQIEWKKFSIVELFTVKNTHSVISREIVKKSGKIPYLTASKENNSVGTYISYDESKIEEGNSIFIGGKTFIVTYQKNDYFSNDSHNLALYYKDTEQRTLENQLFLGTSIFKSLSHKYSWGDSISSKKIQSDSIKLPVTSKVYQIII